VLFSEPKIPQYWYSVAQLRRGLVSVLFSEPKIPQFWTYSSARSNCSCFSALQRAENSSIMLPLMLISLQLCFSALQRAENSSILSVVYICLVLLLTVSVLFSEPKIPQSATRAQSPAPHRRCFSALQRAENSSIDEAERFVRWYAHRFSALQRAENSSIPRPADVETSASCFSALQRAENSSIYEFSTSDDGDERVSVLFSEPKIPQSRTVELGE